MLVGVNLNSPGSEILRSELNFDDMANVLICTTEIRYVGSLLEEKLVNWGYDNRRVHVEFT